MRLTTESIPPRILAAARRAGLRRPDWYVGPRERVRPRQRTLEDIVREVAVELAAIALVWTLIIAFFFRG